MMPQSSMCSSLPCIIMFLLDKDASRHLVSRQGAFRSSDHRCTWKRDAEAGVGGRVRGADDLYFSRCSERLGASQLPMPSSASQRCTPDVLHTIRRSPSGFFATAQ